MIIEKYNPKWTDQYNLIRQMHEQNLREYISIQHAGSTSISGMKEKPFIAHKERIKDEVITYEVDDKVSVLK